MDYENFEGKFYANYTVGWDKQLWGGAGLSFRIQSFAKTQQIIGAEIL